MSLSNLGNQIITYKYNTPLQADYLNTLLHGLVTPGLIKPPSSITVMNEATQLIVNVSPFSFVIKPSDNDTDDRSVKITTSSIVQVKGSLSSIAIVASFSFTSNGNAQSQWYADFRLVQTASEITDNDVVIAHKLTGDTWGVYGADYSSGYLIENGFNPNNYLILKSPRRGSFLDGNDLIFEYRSMYNDKSRTNLVEITVENSIGGTNKTYPIFSGSYENDNLPITTEYNQQKHNSAIYTIQGYEVTPKMNYTVNGLTMIDENGDYVLYL